MKIPIEILVCPECKHDSLEVHSFQDNDKGVQDGVLLCKSCRNWYMIEDNILECLKVNVNQDRRVTFAGKFKDKLSALNLAYDISQNTESIPEIAQKRGQKEFFNEYAETYPQETQNFWLAYYQMTVYQLHKRAKPHSLILDLGCGTGLGTLPFMTGDYTVVGIDISPGILKKAMSRVPREHQNRHFFFVADAEDLPFKKQTFDYCVGMGVLHHFHDPCRAVDSVSDCLKEGGIYYGHENNKSCFRPLFDLLMKCNTLWKEEAGEEPLFSKQNIRDMYTNFTVAVSTHVFLPPHFFNLFNPETGCKLLKATDAFFSSIPLLRDHGGTIVFEAKKH